MEIVITITYAILLLALFLTFIRLLIGPTLPDRVVALELIPSILVSLIGVYAINHNTSSFIDVSIVVALIAFLAAIGFARFLERGGPRDD
ncbi:monovalent cation/H+ antiporter complex subunit F [Aliidiomarina maris]|uniref:Multicomponent Na+:H+ antiporter subunit F n=1 Tax=Aliidiomarina maris TaxID=531312 RepID=A0A327WZ22_9GAMM|nr:monovalent cation/H+ antiporter complex subunit F [Aliidiomarina maris]MCL5051367.1 monovalent cation/H+ antiporter complex subunit F [Bacillota bacterium]RAJ98413.1 multicomponent Na+:H+ antiporter subunit F [Aliidiomarina maris]RUO24772.1 pH regulation protein F [Aliidiomarina maris]